jgi:hypothetical protein
MANDWKPMLDYVNPSIDDSRFLSSEEILLAVGPSRLAQFGGAVTLGAQLATSNASSVSLVYPVGAVQSFSVSQSINLMRFFEIGSNRSYFIPGKHMGQISLGRVLFHGPSLGRILYAYFQDLIPPTTIPAMYPSNAVIKNPHNVILSPGENNMYMNMMSDLFKQPFGMLMYVRDSNEDTYGAQYFEQCYIPNHSLSFDAQGIVLQESCSLQFERIVSIATASIDLITDSVSTLLS